VVQPQLLISLNQLIVLMPYLFVVFLLHCIGLFSDFVSVDHSVLLYDCCPNEPMLQLECSRHFTVAHASLYKDRGKGVDLYSA